MKKLLGKGKVIVSVVSVFAILAVSMLSMFAGVTLSVAANDATEGETTVTYPINGSYDADFVRNDGDGFYYSEPKGTDTNDFTGFATNFITYADGSGTQFDPYIIKTANEFAAVVTGNLYDANNNLFDTQYVVFKIADNIKAFNLNNTNSTVDFSGNMTAKQVEEALKNDTVTAGLEWKLTNPFKGRLNGNGAVVYGLKATGTNAGIIPQAAGNVTVTNLTVKNSYFCGDTASAFVAYQSANPATYTIRNCAAYGNVIICTNMDILAVERAGIVIGHTNGDTNAFITDCLAYDNIAKHETRNITYGFIGRLHHATSATITNCIVMDSVPHTIYHGYNAFNYSTYKNIYTNTCNGESWFNYDGVLAVDSGTGEYIEDTVNGGYNISSGTKYKYTYLANGTVSATFTHYNAAGTCLTNNGKGFKRTFAGPIYNVAPSEVQGMDLIDGIDAEKWIYNENGYPTPKVYNVKETGASVASYEFYEGEGTQAKPYIITTAEEFALMLVSDNSGKFYKLGRDISINDTTVQNWTDNARTWFTSNDVPEFLGTLDGNGKTVRGLYYDGSQKGEYAGLIPVIGSSGNVSKLIVANSSLTAKSGVVGAVIGAIGEKAKTMIKIDAVTVDDTVKFDGNAVKGGIIGRIGYAVVRITNSISESAGIFGENAGIAKVIGCISVNAYPFASLENVDSTNVYTDVDGISTDGVTVVPTDAMKGVAATSSMSGLSFTGTSAPWKVVYGDFPAPTGAAVSIEGAKGQVWSGAVATNFADGNGTADDPYQIETAEQLARAVYLGGGDSHYILTADIYLNDVNGSMWDDKVGCNEWFSNLTTKNMFKNSTLDGDGYVIYGLFYDNTASPVANIYVGLVPLVGAGSIIKNIAMSEAYLNMNHNFTENRAGVLVGCVEYWNRSWPMDARNAIVNKDTRRNPEFQAQQPKIINCVADAKCYVSADCAGGFVGVAYGPTFMENCIFTGSMKHNPDVYWSGTLIGNEWAYGSTVVDCVSFPQTCDTALGGSGGQTWRTGSPQYIAIEWDDVYYFSKYIQRCADFQIHKISKPTQRVGDEAVAAMPELDWVDEFDQEYYDLDTLGYTDPTTLNVEGVTKEGDATTWIAIDGGTPLPSIFAKHRDEEALIALSDTNFTPPNVKVSFMTNTDEVKVDDMEGRMFSKLTLPVVSRDGYEFKGWHVFDDFSYLYDRDYFPPRDLQLFAEWEITGVVQNFETYTDSVWDYDTDQWRLNRPGVKGGYKNAYVRNGARSMRLLDTNTEPTAFLINYEQMLEPGQAYTIKFWVATDKENNPATLLTLVHNEKPVYLDTQVAAENMAVATGLKVGEWVQYSYSFTAQTKWVSLRASGGSSLYFDDIVIGKINGTLNGGKLIGVSTGVGTSAGTVSPNTGDAITVATLISAIMACAIVAVISKKNLVEVID